MKNVLTATATAATLALTLATAAAAGIPNTFPHNVGFPSDATTTQSDTSTKTDKADE
ncbi:hypothetical protein [Tateyamaria sp. SN6-1]|uniref:hypothetical protein n=1 Tax=Tateyamaria sp. SN6-1 TaxID=3092148 RepID=UPI0039F46850